MPKAHTNTSHSSRMRCFTSTTDLSEPSSLKYACGIIPQVRLRHVVLETDQGHGRLDKKVGQAKNTHNGNALRTRFLTYHRLVRTIIPPVRLRHVVLETDQWHGGLDKSTHTQDSNALRIRFLTSTTDLSKPSYLQCDCGTLCWKRTRGIMDPNKIMTCQERTQRRRSPHMHLVKSHRLVRTIIHKVRLRHIVLEMDQGDENFDKTRSDANPPPNHHSTGVACRTSTRLGTVASS